MTKWLISLKFHLTAIALFILCCGFTVSVIPTWQPAAVDYYEWQIYESVGCKNWDLVDEGVTECANGPVLNLDSKSWYMLTVLACKASVQGSVCSKVTKKIDHYPFPLLR